MMMAEHLADKRRWEESMTRDADGVLYGVEGDIEDDGLLPGTSLSFLVLSHSLFFFFFYMPGFQRGKGHLICWMTLPIFSFLTIYWGTVY